MRASFGRQHKALVKVLGLSLLERNILMLLSHNIREMFLAVSAVETSVLKFARGRGRKIARAGGAELKLFIEKLPLGTIGAARAISTASDDLLVVNVDNLTSLDLSALLEHHRAAKAVLTVATHIEPFQIPFGQVSIEDGNIVDYREKPILPVTLCSGTYVMSKTARLRIPSDRPSGAPELVHRLLRANNKVSAFSQSSPWIDVNDSSSVERAEELVMANFEGFELWRTPSTNEMVTLCVLNENKVALLKAQNRKSAISQFPVEKVPLNSKSPLSAAHRLQGETGLPRLGKPFLLASFDELDPLNAQRTRHHVFVSPMVLTRTTEPPKCGEFSWEFVGDLATDPPNLMLTREPLRISNDMSHRRIHILSIIDDLHFGGDEYRLKAFATSLDRERFDHSVLTLIKEDRVIGEKYGSMRDQYRQAGIRLIDFGVDPARTRVRREKGVASQLFSAWGKSRKLASLIRQEEVDVLDVHLSPANPICAVATLNTQTPYAVTLYQLDTVQSPKLWLAGQLNLGNAALLITDSESQAALVSRWLLRRPPIRVIPNGTSPPRPVLTKQAMFKLFNIQDQAVTIIGQVSSLLSYKGHLVLLDAAKRVLDRHPECLFLMVGYERREEGYRELLLRRAASLGIADRVRIAGYPGPIGDVWNIIDIHVHASHLDSLPNALLEAMSLGKPSVVTSVGGIPEVVKHGVNGFLVAPNDPEQLAAGLLRFMDHPDLRTAIGQQAQRTHVQYSNRTS